jgi:hypothetical protein
VYRVDDEAAMKIEDYAVIVAGPVEDLVGAVKLKVKEGWELCGPLVVVSTGQGTELYQVLVKKFDPHAGEAWVKQPGFPGRWEKVNG